MGMVKHSDDDVVEADLRAIVRRYNALLAQHWIAVAAAITIAAGALLTVTALRASAAVFTAALTVSVLLACGAWTCAALRIWRDRLERQRAAALADRVAALDGRLSTWAADPDRAAASPLGALLREQILLARARWTPTAIVPRRFARSLALIPAMLALFAATTFYARPPRTAPLPPETAAAMLVATADQLAAAGQKTTVSHHATAGASQTRAGNAGGTGGDGRGDAANAEGASGSSGHGTGLAEGSADEHSEPGAPDRLRNAIRAAFGADPAGPPTDHTRQANGRRGSDTARADGQGDTSRPDTSQHAAARDTAQPPHDDPTRQPPAGNAAGDDGSRAGASGRGSAPGGTKGLFAQHGEPQPGGDEGETATTRLQLGALAAVAPDHSEPQREPHNAQSQAPAGALTTAPPALAGEQLAGAALHKPQVGPQYEAIIRRVFARQ